MSMHFDPPTDLEVLEYAREGLITKIGSHPAPREYPVEIAEYEAHLKEVERLLRLYRRRGKTRLLVEAAIPWSQR